MTNAVNHDNHPLLTLSNTATNANSADQKNIGCRGIKVVVDITAITAGSLTITIKAKDPVSGKYFTILASAALAAVATTVLTVFPAATAAANVTVNDQLPLTWRVEAVIATGPVTATVAASYLL